MDPELDLDADPVGISPLDLPPSPLAQQAAPEAEAERSRSAGGHMIQDWDPYALDPEQLKPPAGVVIPQEVSDSADYMEGLDEIDSKYRPGFFDEDPSPPT